MGDDVKTKKPPPLVTKIDVSYCLGKSELEEGASLEDIKASGVDAECQRILTDVYYLREACHQLVKGSQNLPGWVKQSCFDLLNRATGSDQGKKKTEWTCDEIELGGLWLKDMMTRDPEIAKQCNAVLETGLKIYWKLRQ